MSERCRMGEVERVALDDGMWDIPCDQKIMQSESGRGFPDPGSSSDDQEFWAIPVLGLRSWALVFTVQVWHRERGIPMFFLGGRDGGAILRRWNSWIWDRLRCSDYPYSC